MGFDDYKVVLTVRMTARGSPNQDRGQALPKDTTEILHA